MDHGRRSKTTRAARRRRCRRSKRAGRHGRGASAFCSADFMGQVTLRSLALGKSGESRAIDVTGSSLDWTESSSDGAGDDACHGDASESRVGPGAAASSVTLRLGSERVVVGVAI